MLLYRLAQEKYVRDLSGDGARLYGGRWNAKGTSMLYTSEHCSLALLELLVHTPHTLLPDKISLLKLSIPDDITISTMDKERLPGNWRGYPAPDSLGKIGTQWINDKKSIGLRVPSVLVPDEWNVLLNPAYVEYKEVSIKSVSSFQIDSRF
jgi:RES domain-containing protein